MYFHACQCLYRKTVGAEKALRHFCDDDEEIHSLTAAIVLIARAYQASEMLSCFYDCDVETRGKENFFKIYGIPSWDSNSSLSSQFSQEHVARGSLYAKKRRKFHPILVGNEREKKKSKNISKEFTFLLLYTLSFYIYFSACEQNFLHFSLLWLSMSA